MIPKEDVLVMVTKDGYIKRTSWRSYQASNEEATLKDNDYVVAALPVRHSEDQLAIISESGLGKKIPLTELVIQKRAGKGLIVYQPTEASGKVACGALVSDEDSVLICGKSSGICILAKDIPSLSRGSLGNQLIKGTTVTSMSKV